MQVEFKRWCMDAKSRTPVSVDPKRVDCTEHYQDAYPGNDVMEAMPAATRIIMKNKQEYMVQGTFAEVVAKLNGAEAAEK